MIFVLVSVLVSMPKKSLSKLYTGKELAFFQELINTPSPTGFEYMGMHVWKDYIATYVDEVFVDPYGTCVGVINPTATFKLVLEAHCDEISRYVKYITDDGLLYVLRNGGSDHQIAPSKRVHIHTNERNIIKGLFGRPAIHTRKGEKEESPKTENIFLDVWAKNKKEVASMGIEVGNVITYEDEFITMNDRYYVGRAMDNRAWGFMIAQVARLLKESKTKLDIGVYFVNAVQEEIGLRGAEMIAHRIKPHIAIITDVCHDTSTPMIDKKIHGDTKCGLGPCLSVGPAVHNKLLDEIKSIAKKAKISYQLDARSRSTGTDTDSFAYSNGGTPSALISLPLRYMHTTVEMVEHSDIDNTIQLMLECVKKIGEKTNLSYDK
jgi:putative aminopeptidase FrvX